MTSSSSGSPASDPNAASASAASSMYPDYSVWNDLDILPTQPDERTQLEIDISDALNAELNAQSDTAERFEVRAADPDATLRPKTLEDIVGQPDIKRSLHVYIGSAKRRREALDHVMLTGPGGLGKTTIAQAIANELDAPLILRTGPGMKSGHVIALASELFTIFDMLRAEGDPERGSPVVFIDEIHGMRREGIESLLPMLEDFTIQDMRLPPFTLIGATTDPSKLPGPFRDRFGIQYQLDFYPSDDIRKIVRRSLVVLLAESPTIVDRYLASSTGQEALLAISTRARGVPRLANRLVKRTIDFMPQHVITSFTPDVVRDAMTAMDIDRRGLSKTDRQLLALMFKRFKLRPVGVKALAAALGESEDNISSVIEPPLVRGGYIDRDPRGRVLTETGQEAALDHMSGNIEY